MSLGVKSLVGVPWTTLGTTTDADMLTVQGLEEPATVSIEDLRKAWTKTLDW